MRPRVAGTARRCEPFAGGKVGARRDPRASLCGTIAGGGTMLLWIASVWAAEPALVCPMGAADTAVDAARDVEVAWRALDADALQAARAALGRHLPCVDRLLTPSEAAVLHRAAALTAYMVGDAEASRRAWVSVHTLMPGTEPLTSVLVKDHPLARLEADAMSRPAGRAYPFVVRPVDGWAVDGSRDAPIPAERAFVFQVLSPDGGVAYTGHHVTVSELPAGAYAVSSDPSLVRAERRAVARAVGTGVASALLAGAVGALAGGLVVRDGLSTAPASEVDERAARANLLGATSAALGGTGAALMTIAWVVRW
ncbi:MAG: hypothetical protein RLZZ383_2165 [Pseudomonadota bacterium]